MDNRAGRHTDLRVDESAVPAPPILTADAAPLARGESSHFEARHCPVPSASTSGPSVTTVNCVSASQRAGFRVHGPRSTGIRSDWGGYAMRTRRLRLTISTSLAVAVVLVHAGPAALYAQTQDPLALTGQVTSAEEGAMEGVLVSAKTTGSTITTTVVSDAQGRYRFPRARLEPGDYAIRIKAVGYDVEGASTVRVTEHQTTTLGSQPPHDAGSRVAAQQHGMAHEFPRDRPATSLHTRLWPLPHAGAGCTVTPRCGHMGPSHSTDADVSSARVSKTPTTETRAADWRSCAGSRTAAAGTASTG